MAKRKEAIPYGDAPLLGWHDGLKKAAHEMGADVGITAEDLTEIDADNAALHAKMDAARENGRLAKEANKAKDDTVDEVKVNVRKLAKRVFGHRAYTEQKGIRLGLIGAEDATDMTQAQPVLVGTALGKGQSEIAFNKLQADGVNLYYKDGADNWVFLARDTQSPYIDNRPLAVANKPEMRTYRAKFVISDQEVGYESDAITVTVTP
jgi:hypothetical protein